MTLTGWKLHKAEPKETLREKQADKEMDVEGARALHIKYSKQKLVNRLPVPIFFLPVVVRYNELQFLMPQHRTKTQHVENYSSQAHENKQ